MLLFNYKYIGNSLYELNMNWIMAITNIGE